MAKAFKICKVCGKEYEYCQTKADGAFRWMDVACCPEHATEYFKEIAISRGEVAEEDTTSKKKVKATLGVATEIKEPEKPAE